MAQIQICDIELSNSLRQAVNWMSRYMLLMNTDIKPDPGERQADLELAKRLVADLNRWVNIPEDELLIEYGGKWQFPKEGLKGE